MRLDRIGAGMADVAEGGMQIRHGTLTVLVLQPSHRPLQAGNTEINRQVVDAPVHDLPRHLVCHDEGHDTCDR